MIYLTRTADGAIAAAETEQRAQALESLGFVRCTLDEFRAAWRERDMGREREVGVG